MNVQKAIELLSKLPPNGQLMVASINHGGSVPLQDFQVVGDNNGFDPWIDVVFCDDEEREGYNVAITT